jgi:RNA polymerase sigma factor (sigma-70 family)
MASGQLGGVLDYLRQVTAPPDGDGLTDRALLAGFVERREEAAFAALVQRHGPMVLGVCRRVLGDAHDAEDAFQATFLVLARRAASVRKQESVGSWLYGVAYRTALKARTGAARRRARERQARAMTQADPAASAAWQELRPLLDAELSRLPEKYRAPLVLCYLEGKTNQEAARQLGWTKGTVSGRLARARDLLRARLGRRGLALAPVLLVTALYESTASAAVPAPLALSTVKAATAGAPAAAAAGVVSARTAALAEGVLQAMFLSKIKTVVLALTAVVVLGAGGGLVTYRSLADGPDPGGADRPAASERPADRARTDTQRLQGTWVAVAAIKNGERPADEMIRAIDFRIRFAGPRLTITRGTKQIGTATYRLDPKARPREIAFPEQNFDNHRQAGIYKLEGDTLTLCLRDADKGPPTEFTAERGAIGGQQLIVLRREKQGVGGERGGGQDQQDPARLREENERLRRELEQARRALEQARRVFEQGRREEARARAEAEAERLRPEDARRAAEREARRENDAVKKIREAAARAVSQNNLKQMALAMHNYVDVYKHFPTPAIYSEEGRPLLSWRVAILPYIEQQDLYKQFKVDEPWDSPHNKKLLDRMPAIYASPVPGKAKKGYTFYQVFRGKGTMFPGPKGVGVSDVTDGLSNTVLIVEGGEAVPWTKPADLPYKKGQPLPKLGGIFGGGFGMALADGSARFVRPNFDPEVLEAMITRSGGETVDVDKLNR